MKFFIYTLFIFFIAPSLWSQAWKTYPYIPVDSEIIFPNDEGRHPDETIEWWYSIGHFTGEETGTPYSYMLTYFYAKQLGFDGFRILSLCNEATGEFFTETLPLQYASIATDKLNIQALVGYLPVLAKRETWSNAIDDGNSEVPFVYNQKAASSNFSLDFSHETTKRPLLVADNGYMNIGVDTYTYYYSQTKNILSGSLTLNGKTELIQGTSWIDRQYGNFNAYDENRYEWFSIQLSNGMELLTYNIFTADGEIPDKSEFRIMAVSVDDDTQYTTSDFEIERLSFKYTDDKERCYSQSWRLTSDKNKIDIIYSALHISNEVQLPLRFFEGTVTISGTVNGAAVTGKGFAELIHSYEVPDVVFNAPVVQSSDSLLLSWQVQNKDEGNPLYYSLSYSLNLEKSLNPIVSSIKDTSIVWQLPLLENNDLVNIYLTANSVDGTLSTEKVSTYNHIISSAPYVNNRNKARVYPNPASGTINISGIENSSLEIINMNGQIVYSKNAEINKLKVVNIEGWGSGIYLLKVTSLEQSYILKFRVN